MINHNLCTDFQNSFTRRKQSLTSSSPTVWRKGKPVLISREQSEPRTAERRPNKLKFVLRWWVG